MKIKRRRFDFFLVLLVLLASASNTLAKWGFSKSSSSRSSSRSSSSYSRPSTSYSRPSPSYSSYSRPSPSYSRPSPSYSTYSRPAASPAQFSYPSYSRPASSPSYSYSSPASSPSYGWNVVSRPSSGFGSNTPSFGTTASKPSTNYGWNVGSTNTNTAPKPASTNYGWNVGNTNTAPKPSAPVGPPPSYPGFQNRPAPGNNAPPAYYPNQNNPPSYSQNYHTQPSYSPSHHNQQSHSPSYHSSPTYRPSYNSSPSYKPSYSPSYSSSYNNRKSYTTERYIPRQSVSNAYSPNPGHQPHNNYYGNAFGRQGLPSNTYLSNNYYGGYKKSGKSGFLTNALFLGGGLAGGYALGRYTSRNGEEAREWGEDDDKRWRATTKAPYFENKIPGEEKVLPASAVIGAATAFGLVSLLPLNVPKGMPLMYCNDTYLMQSHIQINGGNIYQCVNNTIQIWCPQKFEKAIETSELLKVTTELPIVSTELPISTTNQPIVTTEVLYTTNAVDVANITESMSEAPEILDPRIFKREADLNEQQLCINKTMECDVVDDKSSGIVYCSNGNLFSTTSIFCNSTTIFDGQISILNCYDGQLPETKAAFIPTTAQPPVETTEKPLSFGQKVTKFLRKFFGMENNSETTTQAPTEIPQLSADSWYPEALTISPEVNETSTVTADTTTEPPFEWMKPVQVQFENGTHGTKLEPIPLEAVQLQEQINARMSTATYKIEGNPAWVKVYKTNLVETTTPSVLSENSESTTVSEVSTSIEPLDF